MRARIPISPRRAAPRGERGAALLTVLLVVAVLTAMAVELAYQTRVSLQLAANGRDELKAAYQARGAVALSRLVLHFQQRLDGASSTAASLMARPGADGKTAQAPSFSFRLWEVVPVDSATTALFLGSAARESAWREDAAGRDGAAARGSAAEAGGAGKPAAPRAGTPAGPGESFVARIEDEERKVNVAQLSGLSAVAGPQLQRFLLATRDPVYDVLFDHEDANGNRFTRRDVAAALKDWVDEDSTTSVVGTNPALPFEEGFADENFAYDRGDDRYKAKNARYDSLDELFMVSGVSDAFMAAFGDQLTVYPDVNAPTNINTDDPGQMLVNVLLMSDPPGVPQPPVLDPAFPQRLQAALRLARPLPFMTITVQQFATLLQALGVRVQPLFLQPVNTDARSPFGNKSSTFTIRATGRAGAVERSIDAVVTMDARAGGLSADLGRVIHWRED